MLPLQKYVPLLSLLLLISISCSQKKAIESELTGNAVQTDIQDRSCAYFYYLWGNHAEFNQQFPDALDAYKKAYVCDPEAPSLLEKLVLTHLKMGDGSKAAQYLQLLAEKHPEDIERQLLLARLFIYLNRLDEAAILYSKILDKDPKNESALIQLSLIYSLEKNFEKAEAALRSVISINSKSYSATLYLARLFVTTGHINDATEWYKKALTISRSQELINEMINFYSIHQQYEELLALYSSLHNKEPANETAGLGIIQTLLMLDREEEAKSRLPGLKLLSEDPFRYDLVLARFYFNKNDLNKAESVLKTALKKQNESSLHYLLALVYFEQNKDQQALAHLKNLGPEDDEYQDAIHFQVRILQKLEKFEDAIILLQQKLTLSEHILPIDYLLLASLYQETGNNNLATDILKKGMEAFPEDEQLLFELGVLYDDSGQQDLAIETMQQLLAINRNHAEALNYIGYTWAEKNVHLQKALDYIQQAVKLLPKNGYLRDSLGWVYFRLGNMAEARKELEYAISLVPNDPLIHTHLGDVYSQLLLPEKAIESYQKAHDLSQRKEEKEQLENKINTLRGKK